jgi:type I restriction enzyme S subunit
MEVRPGYKKTEVGIVTEDWEVEDLGRFWSVTDCKHVTAKFILSGIPVASIREVQSRFVDLTNAKQTSLHYYDLLIEGGRKPLVGDLIMSRNATVGEVAQVSELHPPFAMGQDVCLLRRKHQDFSPDFLQALFQSRIVGNQLSDLMVGSTFKRANVEQIRNFTVPMPGPREQQAIGGALSDLDSLTDALEQLIAKKRDLKQAAMQQLLTGQTRLPGFSGEWKVKRLGEVATFLKGRGLPKSDLDTFGFESCIHYGELFTQYPEVIREIISRTSTRQAAFRSVANDVLMPTSDVTPRGLAKASCITVGGVILGGDILVIRTDPRQVNGSFLSYIIRREKNQVLQLVTGSTVFHLYGSDMRNFEFRLPAIAEQIAITNLLMEMEAELEVLEQRLAKTRDLKQAMMQELLTGRIRLVPPEARHG